MGGRGRGWTLALVLAMALAGATRAGAVTLPVGADPGVLLGVAPHFSVASTSEAVDGMPIYSTGLNGQWRRTGSVLSGRRPRWLRRGESLWAPQLYRLLSGQFVAVYSGVDGRRGSPTRGKRCIGIALARAPRDFTDTGRPFCDPGHKSLIDPYVFTDPITQLRYLLFKRDQPGRRTIAIAPFRLDALTVEGAVAHDILTPTQTWERASRAKPSRSSVEAPTMIYRDGSYWLFYSGNAYGGDGYGVGVARAASPTANFDPGKDPANPILTGLDRRDRCGLGGQDVAHSLLDGWVIFFHTYRRQAGYVCRGKRYLMRAALSWGSGWPAVTPPS